MFEQVGQGDRGESDAEPRLRLYRIGAGKAVLKFLTPVNRDMIRQPGVFIDIRIRRNQPQGFGAAGSTTMPELSRGSNSRPKSSKPLTSWFMMLSE